MRVKFYPPILHELSHLEYMRRIFFLLNTPLARIIPACVHSVAVSTDACHVCTHHLSWGLGLLVSMTGAHHHMMCDCLTISRSMRRPTHFFKETCMSVPSVRACAASIKVLGKCVACKIHSDRIVFPDCVCLVIASAHHNSTNSAASCRFNFWHKLSVIAISKCDRLDIPW